MILYNIYTSFFYIEVTIKSHIRKLKPAQKIVDQTTQR